jgi:hypothetical protein
MFASDTTFQNKIDLPASVAAAMAAADVCKLHCYLLYLAQNFDVFSYCFTQCCKGINIQREYPTSKTSFISFRTNNF